MFTLSLKEGGTVLGTIDEADLRVLVDQLVEETDEDTDYYINAATIDLLAGAGASPGLITMLKNAIGGAEGVDIVWREA